MKNDFTINRVCRCPFEASIHDFHISADGFSFDLSSEAVRFDITTNGIEPGAHWLFVSDNNHVSADRTDINVLCVCIGLDISAD